MSQVFLALFNNPGIHCIGGKVGHRTILDDLETRKISCLYEDLTQLHSFQHAVAQLVEALCYKPEGHGFHSQWCH
jgi:hypothetical protein